MIEKINTKNILGMGKYFEPKPLHFILGDGGQNKLGEIDNIFNINYHPQLQSSEISFTVYKSVDGKECRLWNEIIQRRLLWVKEYNEWFEIYVELDDSEKITKKK